LVFEIFYFCNYLKQDCLKLPEIKIMKLRTEPYKKQEERLPKNGQQIVGQINDGQIVVYQAFNSKIARYAIENQRFGGSYYSFERMSWIKPNFLWMMYRAGWASKEHQQNILAISLPLERFREIFNSAVHSSFQKHIYQSEEQWKQKLQLSQVRLQWDPDHDPNGNKLERRAVQLGLRGEILRKFAAEWIIEIEDITDFVKGEHQKVLINDLDNRIVPCEEIIEI
jgi:hypothetical protein